MELMKFENKDCWDVQRKIEGFGSDNLKEIVEQALNEEALSDQVYINLAYTNYGGSFLDKVYIEYFKQNHPDYTLSELTSYNGQNAFIVGKVARDFVEAYESYPLGFETLEDFYSELEHSEVEEVIRENIIPDFEHVFEVELTEQQKDLILSNVNEGDLIHPSSCGDLMDYDEDKVFNKINKWLNR